MEIKSGETQRNVQRDPLLVDLILRALFRNVDYDALKECRLVSHKWKNLSDAQLVKRSAFVCTTETKNVPQSMLESPVDIPSIFESISANNVDVRFSAFKYEYNILTPLVKEMYLDPYILTMSQLEITGKRTSGLSPTVTFNIGDVIGPNLAKLKLDGHWGQWPLSLEKLTSLHQIDLQGCIIIVTPGAKMAPKELTIKGCSLQDKDSPSDPPINMADILDFGSLLKLDLSDFPGNKLLPIINWSDCANIKCLSLYEMNINLHGKISPEELTILFNTYKTNEDEEVSILRFGSHISSICLQNLNIWSNNISAFDFENFVPVEKLEITGSFRGINIETKIRQLVLHDSDFAIDLSILPSGLEYLKFINYEKKNFITCSDSVFFPNLKRLSISGYINNLSYFRKCTSIIYLELDNWGCSRKPPLLNVKHLPPNIKGLSFCGKSKF